MRHKAAVLGTGDGEVSTMGLDMDVTTATARSTSGSQNPKTVLSVLLTHFDSGHERLGRAYLESLLQKQFTNVKLELTEWRFDMLGSAMLRRVAVIEAADADLVVIATVCDEGLPKAVKRWFEAWSVKRGANSVLVVLLTESDFCPGVGWPDYSYISNKASRCGRKLLVYLSDGAQEDFSHFCPANARRIMGEGLACVSDFSDDLGFHFDPGKNGT
jgi:hypothetical protein